MTHDEQLDIAERLLVMQNMLRDVCDCCRQHAKMCQELDQPGLAFAAHMVAEAIAAFAKEVVRYTENALDS